jgi:hypothetical protein
VLKKRSVFLIALTVVIGFHAHAEQTLEDTLQHIPFKDICQGEGGEALGDQVYNEAQAIIRATNTKISELNNRLTKTPNNKGAQALLSSLKERFQNWNRLSSELNLQWSEGCRSNASRKASRPL